jgi:hypothetical protein
MPMERRGWELLIKRVREETRKGRRRTVGHYQVFHDGKPAGLSGTTLETRGPGDNGHAGNNRCVEAGRYRIRTQDGHKYCTIGYTASTNPAKLRRPALELADTGHRSEILLHPGRGFLSSVGCINPSKALAGPGGNIEFVESRARAIAIIDDLKGFLGDDFPKRNDRPIPNAAIIIEDARAPR